MKNTITLLLLNFAASIAAMFLLYKFSTQKAKTGFIRHFPSHILGKRNEIDLRWNSYYLAGSKDSIYLANSVAVNHLLAVDLHSLDTSSHIIAIPENSKLVWPALRITASPPYVYYHENNTAFTGYSLLSSNLMNREVKSSVPFDLATQVSPTSLIIRNYDTLLSHNVLSKLDLNSNKITKKLVLKKQIDGSFCTDGMLSYDPASASGLYMYYYRNQVTVFDSALTVALNLKTVDTVSRAQIKVSIFQKQGQLKALLSAPPLRINASATINQGYIFIHSLRKADNESTDSFEKSSVIDVYSASNSRYLFSFYIPSHHGKKLRQFAVQNGVILILYEHHILSFELDFSGLKNMN